MCPFTYLAVLVPALAVSSIVYGQAPGRGEKDALDLPELNRRVLDFVDAHLNRRVGKGQCWDLAAEALKEAGASWDGRYGFGEPIDPKKQDALPGDIIQFEGVLVEYSDATSRAQESMSHHTAIVHDVHEAGHYTLAHQNFGRAGRKVSLLDLRVEHIVKGTFTIYRPRR